MPQVCHNRLTVIGPRAQVECFQLAPWDNVLKGRHCELLESSPGRFGYQFETDRLVLGPLQRLSREWPRLILIVECEPEAKRLKGLAKAQAGRLEYYEVTY